MAVNRVAVDHNRVPWLSPEELHLRTIDNVSLDLKWGGGYPGNGGTLTTSGTLYISPYRLILVPSKPNPKLFSVVLPVGLIRSITENTGWMGSTSYVSADIGPMIGGGLNMDGHFTLTMDFSEGVAELVLRLQQCLIAELDDMASMPRLGFLSAASATQDFSKYEAGCLEYRASVTAVHDAYGYNNIDPSTSKSETKSSTSSTSSTSSSLSKPLPKKGKGGTTPTSTTSDQSRGSEEAVAAVEFHDFNSLPWFSLFRGMKKKAKKVPSLTSFSPNPSNTVNVQSADDSTQDQSSSSSSISLLNIITFGMFGSSPAPALATSSTTHSSFTSTASNQAQVSRTKQKISTTNSASSSSSSDVKPSRSLAFATIPTVASTPEEVELQVFATVKDRLGADGLRYRATNGNTATRSSSLT